MALERICEIHRIRRESPRGYNYPVNLHDQLSALEAFVRRVDEAIKKWQADNVQ